jgi:dipeptidyl-peptidase 4
MRQARLGSHAYETAERLLRHHRDQLVLGGKIKPRWIAGGASFWYTLGTRRGRQFILARPADGIREPAFDHQKLAAALSQASGQDVDPDMLPFTSVELADGVAEFSAFGERWRYRTGEYVCERIAPPAPRNLLEVVAPDGKHAVFRDGPNLRARSLSTSAGWALTDDGTRDQDYGANPDFPMYTILLRKVGLPHLPPAALWSPDSARVLTHRTDQRGVRETYLVDALPPGGGAPLLLTQRVPLPGDERMPLAEFVVLDIAAGKAVPALADPVAMPMMSPISHGWAWWASDSSAVYYLDSTRDGKVLSLHRLDPDTGEVRTLMSEAGPTRVEPAQYPMQRPMVKVLAGEEEVLWYSQRDGWGHLYLHGARDGELRVQVTSGPWAVRELLHVDEEQRVVYFVASGLIGADPYRRTVCRASLDGSGFTRITDDDLDHVVTVPPDPAYFIDSASTNEREPVITARSWDGRVLVELERADVSRLLETGWEPPERFRVTGADGKTDIYGMLYRPHGFDPGQRYPVLDHPYCYPSGNRVTPSFDAGHYGYDAEALAALGFAVMAVDGRGSPGRSKAFHDASYGRISEAGGLSDHVAALRELARSRPWMDLGRVGVTGISAGGFATVRAMLDFPDVFKAGVAESGMHDIRFVELSTAERYNGRYDAARYAEASNVDIADRLAGPLLLVHGGLDESVPPYLTLRLVERLVAADKDFEMLLIPGADHIYIGYEHHVNRRRWDFLVRHLLQAEPPAGYRLTPVPMDLDAFVEVLG